MREEEKIHFLKNISPFSSLGHTDLVDIAGTMEVASFAPKATIISTRELWNILLHNFLRPCESLAER